MKSSRQSQFSRTPTPQIQRSVFNRDHAYKSTFNSGFLIPFFVDEILPGDTMSFRASMFARLSTFVFPIMDNLHLDTHYFFVPNRLVWDNFEKFLGSQDNPDDSTDFVIPQLGHVEDTMSFDTNSIFDYMGLPVGVEFPFPDAGLAPNALPLRAYNLIYNEWFRDQDLQDSVDVLTDDGPDPYLDYNLLRRGKRHDYFTSARPWPQKGPDVMIPLGELPVIGNGDRLGLTDGTSSLSVGIENGSSQTRVGTSALPLGSAFTATPVSGTVAWGVSQNPAFSGLVVDPTAYGTINMLREAAAIQQYLERAATGGTRYVEWLWAQFKVISPDFRLQRPEYLGGGSQRVGVSSVPQTSETASTPQGNLSAYAKVGASSGFNKSFVEHGYVIGLVSVRADLSYQQQLHKMWTRRTKFDFYVPVLANLGEQAVLKHEMLFSGTSLDTEVFGYQERWSEYKYRPSMVTGLFRSVAAGTLDSWHLALDFGTTPPPLGADFILDNPPVDRVVAVTSEPQILFDSFIQIRHARAMPVFSIPGLNRF